MSAQSATGQRALGQVARGGMASLLGAGLAAVLNLVTIVVILRMYSAEVAGALFAATSLFLIVTAAVECGIDQGFVRFVAQRETHLRGTSIRPMLWAGFTPVLLLGAVASVIGILLAETLGSLITAGGAEGATAMIGVLAVAVPFAAVYEGVLAATRGFGSMTETVLIERIARPALQVMLVAICGLLHGGPAVLTVTWAAPYPICLIAALVSLRRYVHRPLGPRAEPSTAIAREFWRFTAAQGGARVAQVALQRADVVIVSAMLGAPAAAIYAAATRFLVVGQVAVQAVQQALQPRLAHLLAAGDHSAIELVYKRCTVWFVGFAWPFYLALATTSPLLMRAFFGDEYAQGAASLTLLSIAMLIATGAGPVDVLLLMSGRSVLSLINMCVALALDVALCFLLIPELGIFGAAVAWAAAIVTRNALGTYQARRFLDVHAMSSALAGVSLIAIACFGAVPLIFYAAAPTLFASIASLCAGGVVYIIVLHRLRHRLGLDEILQVLRRATERVAKDEGVVEAAGSGIGNVGRKKYGA